MEPCMYIGLCVLEGEVQCLPSIRNSVETLQNDMIEMFGADATWKGAVELLPGEPIQANQTLRPREQDVLGWVVLAGPDGTDLL